MVLGPLMVDEVTSSAVSLPSLLMFTRIEPSSPRRTLLPSASATFITSTKAYNTARISAPLTVLIFSMSVVRPLRSLTPVVFAEA